MQGDLVASGSTDESVQVWNMRQRQILWQFQHQGDVNCVKLHENWLISCSEDNSTRIWDLEYGKQIHRLEQSSPCNNFDISPDESLIAVATDYELVLLDFSKLTTIKKFKLRSSHMDVRFNQSGSRLIVGIDGGEVFKIDLVFDSENEEQYGLFGGSGGGFGGLGKEFEHFMNSSVLASDFRTFVRRKT